MDGFRFSKLGKLLSMNTSPSPATAYFDKFVLLMSIRLLAVRFCQFDVKLSKCLLLNF